MLKPQHRAIAALLGCGLAALLMGATTCANPARIQNFDLETRYIEFSQSGYALMLGCGSLDAEEFLWEFFDADGNPLDVGFYDVGATTNADGVLVDEKFTGTERPHECWQPVDLHHAGVINFKNPGPLPHGWVRLTINGGADNVTHPFRIGTMAPKAVTMINTNGYITMIDEPYRRWFRGDEVVADLLAQREIDKNRKIWFMGWNQPEQSWAGNNAYFFEKLGDGRSLQNAVSEAFAAVEAYNATAPAGERIPRGWFGVDFRPDLSRKRDAAKCCIDDGSGNCDKDHSVTSPNLSFIGCGGPYGSPGGAKEWCGLDGEGGVGTSTCHEADGSYGGLEGVPMPGGGVGKPDSLTADRLVYVDRALAEYQDDLYGVLSPPCTNANFRDFDRDWFCDAYGTKRCLHGPDAGDACEEDADCTLGACREAVPIFYGHVTESIWPRPRGGFSNQSCRNPYGYCAHDPHQTCESSADCGGRTCVLGEPQDHCRRDASTGIGIWDRRDPGTRESLIGMFLHILEEGWNLRPGTPTDHFIVTFGGEALFYYDRDTSCRGDRPGCDRLDSSDNTFAHKIDQFAYADINDHRMHYRNPTKAGEYEYFDSLFYSDFVDALAEAGYSDDTSLIHHGAKYVAPVTSPGVSNHLWWMTEPARQRLSAGGRDSTAFSITTEEFIPGGLNGQAPEPRPDSMGYAFRSDQPIALSARHASIDDGKPTVGTAHAGGALWSSWMIDPADDPAVNCPLAMFEGPHASGAGPTALCTTQSADCAVGPDGLCAEASRDACTIDPADPRWGRCRNLVLNVFDYDNRTSGTCSENVRKRCTSDRDCTGSCQPRASIGAANIGIPVTLTELSAAELTSQVDLDFGGPGCADSEGANRATYVGDGVGVDCDAPGGLLDVGGLAHVEVLDQASPPFGSEDVVVLEGRFRKVGGHAPASAPGAKLGFGFLPGQGWEGGAPADPSSRVVRSAATRNAPQLWFGRSDVYLRCVDRISERVSITDDASHDFSITWSRGAGAAELIVDGVRAACTMPSIEGDVGGFLVVPADPVMQGGEAFPFDIVWSDLSLHGP